ncbi:hypothetical protein [Dulcicalothrix desertica]|uniref:hypothetical protein n=1 Tax=Dulcicalothrix desertica TaxID=32056 RepID=UPI000F8DCFB4|nr:hypothetical protein [Dulcicalothrix desertica]
MAPLPLTLGIQAAGAVKPIVLSTTSDRYFTLKNFCPLYTPQLHSNKVANFNCGCLRTGAC